MLLKDLIECLTKIIIDIRNNSSNYSQLFQVLENLDQQIKKVPHIGRGGKNQGAAQNAQMFYYYKLIVNISLEFRKLLAKLNDFFKEVDIYDSLVYSFYSDNHIFFTKELDLSWLSATKAGLMVNIGKAAKDLQESYTDLSKIQLMELFNAHYLLFKKQIEQDYFHVHKFAIGAKGYSHDINYGHIAEAHQRHLQEHHRRLYQYTQIENPTAEDAQSIMSDFLTLQELNNNNKWHEDSVTRWNHIKESLGFLRGTVGGDVGATQVKSSLTNNGTLRLTSWNNLRQGVRIYSEILSPEIPPREVAAKIAIYMSDIVDDDIRRELNYSRGGLYQLLYHKDGFNNLLDKLVSSNIEIRL